MAIAKFLENLLKQCTDVFFGQGENPRENQACARRVERLRVRPRGGRREKTGGGAHGRNSAVASAASDEQ